MLLNGNEDGKQCVNFFGSNWLSVPDSVDLVQLATIIHISNSDIRADVYLQNAVDASLVNVTPDYENHAPF